jgi:acetyl-CoA acetyltransferase
MDKNWGYAQPFDDVRGEVAIVGVGEAEHTAASGRDPVEMGLDAVQAALDDAGLRPDQVDGLMFSGGMPGQVDAAVFHRRFHTSHDLWVSGQGGAMTWAATAPYEAAQAIRGKKASTIVNVFSIDWATQVQQQTGGPANYHHEEPLKANLEVVYGLMPQPVYFATIARRHFFEFGSDERQLGALAVTLRRHANRHPGAVMRKKPLTIEQYLDRKPFIEPFRLEDCCLISDGAAAYVMTAADRAAAFPNMPAIVEGVGHGLSRIGTYFSQQPAFTSTPQVFSAPAAFSMARIDPREVDVLAVYDPFTIVALMQIEDMGFCAKGEAGRMAAEHKLYFETTRQRGGLPFNTHGGLLSHAYVLGISHVVELVRQLRGTAANQVVGAKIAVYGGYTGADAGTLVLRRGEQR